MLVVALPLGTGLGGILVSTIGARSTILTVALATLSLGLFALLVSQLRTRR